jgi:hypothetical protein
MAVTIDGPPSNGLGFSGGAPLDRESCRAVLGFKIATILLGAQRRPLQARVGPPDSERYDIPLGKKRIPIGLRRACTSGSCCSTSLVALVREALIELDQFNELLAIATVIGMIPLCQGTKALLDLHDSRIRWQP